MEDAVSPEVRVFPNLEALSRAAAQEIARLVRDAVAPSSDGEDEAAEGADIFSVALAGGSTPKRLYEHLAAEYADVLDWSRLHLFWGDERFVGLEAADSNHAMAQEALLRHVPIPAGNVHPVPTDRHDSPQAAAEAYEAELRSFFPDVSATASRGGPPFDLVLLGVGEDGHTASLFPHSSAASERERWVVASQAPPEASPRERVTLTRPALEAARHVFMLASGEAKQGIVRDLLEAPERAVLRYPAAQLHPRGRLVWWVDRAAIGLDGRSEARD